MQTSTIQSDYNPYLGEEHEPQPQVDSVPIGSLQYAKEGYLPELSFKVVNNTVDYGTPIYGEIILFPRRKVPTNRVRLRIVALQTARLGWSSAAALNSKHKILTRRYPDTILNITSDGEVPKKSSKFTLPFCVEFPTWSDHTCCSCSEGREDTTNIPSHEFLPPSHGCQATIPAKKYPLIGTTISYHLEALVDGTGLIADYPINFLPSSFLMSHGRSLEFKHYVESTIVGSLGQQLSAPFRRTTPNLTFTADMIYHDISEPEGNIWILCTNKDQIRDKIEKITYYVHKKSYSCPTGDINDHATTLTMYPIAGGKSNEDTLLAPGTTSIAVTYSLARNKKIKVVPSYLSCITAVIYELEVVFKCTSQKYRLSIPLICASNLYSFKLGEQDSASTADLHFNPQECPSLIEDCSEMWDLKSEDDTIFTMEPEMPTG